MNLIFIYGPPAAGKLTVARALSKLTGYKVYDNHRTVECLTPLFPFEDERLNAIRRKLQRKMRIDIFSEAAKAGIDFITTCAVAGPQHFDFYGQVNALVTENGGRVLFVQLAPAPEVLFMRVESESRKGVKIESRERLQSLLQDEPELLDKYPGANHLTIDNSDVSPETAAKEIVAYYGL